MLVAMTTAPTFQINFDSVHRRDVGRERDSSVILVRPVDFLKLPTNLVVKVELSVRCVCLCLYLLFILFNYQIVQKVQKKNTTNYKTATYKLTAISSYLRSWLRGTQPSPVHRLRLRRLHQLRKNI